MDKLKMHTRSKADENFAVLSELFPNAITETIMGYDGDGNAMIERAIDADVLRQEISRAVVEGNEERYQFTWPGKKKAILLANAPTENTLRPCREESVDFEDTKNLYIEGDNLDVLKILQETYLGKIKLIYIDPPYNTGNDFVYNDDFSERAATYMAGSGQYDKEGNRLLKNPESSGRFHTNWLNFIYPRIKIAKNLLSEDGVFFVSIDDHEVDNLKKICNEIFGEQNFEGHIHWRRRHNQPNDKTKMIAIVTEHILVYAKNSRYLKTAGVGKLDLTASFTNPDNDPKGPWASKPWKVGSDQSGSRYTIVTPTGKVLDGEWMGEEKTYQEYLKEGRIYFPRSGEGMPRKKYYQSERQEEGQCATNWWPCEQFGHNQGANDCMTELFGTKNLFSNPKPTELIRAILKIGNVKEGDIVLDFFSGSSSTAQAVLQLNAEDNGRRRFIMVQLPEKTDEKSEAYQAGYQNICEIGKERIRRAGEQILKKKTGIEELDIGFRVLKLDSTNMKEVYYHPMEMQQILFDSCIDNIKEDRTPEDLLFQVMLELGILLSGKIEETEIAGKKVFDVEEGQLIACFDSNVTEETIRAVARKKPHYAVFRDSSMADDNVAANFEQIFVTYSPDTVRRVL